jgi:hypothetical protein
MKGTAKRVGARVLLLSAVVTALIGSLMVLVSPAGATTVHWVNDDDQSPPRTPPGTSCKNPGYASIAAAVTAAAGGDTIVVCPGTYAESVTVNKSLSLRGFNTTIRDCFGTVTPNPLRDTIVDPPGTLTGTGFNVMASGVSIQGFVIKDADTGIFTSPTFAGYTLKENTLLLNKFGIHLHSSGASPTKVTRNCFHRNAQTMGGDGIFSNAGVSDAAITNNWFFKTEVPLMPTADAADISMFGIVSGVQITDNTSLDSATFTAISDSTNSQIMFNKVNGTGQASGIFIGANNQGLTISHNKVEDVRRGIRFCVTTCGGGMPSMGLTVVHNRVTGATGTGMDDGGIVANAGSLINSLLKDNKVTGGAGQGLHIQMLNSGNTLLHNDARGNIGVDCVDESIGMGTAMTANTWTDNKGDQSVPPGICFPAGADDGADDGDDDGGAGDDGSCKAD